MIMNIKELKDAIKNCDDNLEIIICGRWESEGEVLSAEADFSKDGKECFVIDSDICNKFKRGY